MVGGCGVVAAAGEQGAVAASVVVPVGVFEGGELDVAQPLPWSSWVDELPLVEPVEALDHGVEAPIGQDFVALRLLLG